jgi:hypothetical protein
LIPWAVEVCAVDVEVCAVDHGSPWEEGIRDSDLSSNKNLHEKIF